MQKTICQYREPNPKPRLSSDRTDCKATNQLSCLPAVGRHSDWCSIHSAVSATEIDQPAGSGNSSWTSNSPSCAIRCHRPFWTLFFFPDLFHKTNFTGTKIYTRQ